MVATRQRSSLPKDLDEKLRSLGRRDSPEIRFQTVADASDLLQSLKSHIEKNRDSLSHSQITAIRSRLGRWCAQKSFVALKTVRFSDATVRATCETLLSLIRSEVTTISRDSTIAREVVHKKGQGFARKCFTDLAHLVEKAESPLSSLHLMLFLRNVPRTSVKVSTDSLYEWLSEKDASSFEDKLVDCLVEALHKGRADDAESVFNAIGSSDPLHGRFLNAVRKLWEREAAMLPYPSQDWVCRTLGFSVEKAKVEFIDPAESPEIRQAASLLLFLLDHANDSANSREAFQRFRTLCEKHFKLILRGEVGGMMEYDPRVHEAREGVSGNVRILRPWVELSSPPKAAIVIRALVADV